MAELRQPAVNPPQGGVASARRWLLLGVVTAAFALSIFQRFAPAGIAQDLAAAFQTSAASLGVLAASYFWVYTVMQVPTGVLADTLGPRRILLLGGVVSAGGSLLFGLAPGLCEAMLGRTLIGLGVSVTFIAMLKIIALWFEERRFATVTGVTIIIGNLGAVLAGTPLTLLAASVGWRQVYLALAGVSLLVALACWALVRDRPTGDAAVKPLRLAFDRTVVFGALWSVVRNRATWAPAVFNTGLCGSIFAFVGLWAMPFLTQVHGHSRAVAATHLSIFFASVAIGGFLMGVFSDRIRRRKPVAVVGALIYGAIWLLWLFPVSLPLAASYALFALFGLSGASFTLSWACAKEVNPPMLSGMSTSVANLGGFLAAAILQPLVGWVMDLGWDGRLVEGMRYYDGEDYRLGILMMALVAWLGVAAAICLQETGCRNIWRDPSSSE